MQGLFRYLPQWLFGPLFPQQQTVNQKYKLAGHKSSPTIASCHNSGSQLRIIAEQIIKKPPLVDGNERLSTTKAKQRRNLKPTTPKIPDQGPPLQRDALRTKPVSKVGNRRQPSTSTRSQVLSCTWRQHVVGWLVLRLLFMGMEKRIISSPNQAQSRKPLTSLDASETNSWVDKILSYKPEKMDQENQYLVWSDRHLYGQNAGRIEAKKKPNEVVQTTPLHTLTEGADNSSGEQQPNQTTLASHHQAVQRPAYPITICCYQWAAHDAHQRGYTNLVKSGAGLVDMIGNHAEKSKNHPHQWLTQVYGKPVTAPSEKITACTMVVRALGKYKHTRVVWMTANKCIQYANFSAYYDSQAVIKASFEVRRWEQLDSPKGFRYCVKKSFFQSSSIEESTAHTVKFAIDGYGEQGFGEKMAQFEGWGICLSNLAATVDKPIDGVLHYNRVKQTKGLLPGSAKQEYTLQNTETPLKRIYVQGNRNTYGYKGSWGVRLTAGRNLVLPGNDSVTLSRKNLVKSAPVQLRFGKIQPLIEIEKLHQLTTVIPNIFQQAIHNRKARLSTDLQDCDRYGFSQPNVKDSRKEKGQLRMLIKEDTDNDQAGRILLHLRSFSEISAATRKIQRAVRNWLGGKGKNIFYNYLYLEGEEKKTQKVTYADWFNPLGECVGEKITKWQERAKAVSSLTCIASNKRPKALREKENIPPSPQNQLLGDDSSLDNNPFVTPIKLRTYTASPKQDDWTPIISPTESTASLSSIEKPKRVDSPEEQILLEAKRRLEEAVQLLTSLKHDPNQDVHTVIEKITIGQEDMLERIERARHEREKNCTLLSPSAKVVTPIKIGSLPNPKLDSPKPWTTDFGGEASSQEKATRHRPKKERKLEDREHKRKKDTGDIKAKPGEKSASPPFQKDSILKRIVDSVGRGWKNDTVGPNRAVEMRSGPRRTRSDEKLGSENKVSAFALRRIYSESLLARRVSPSSTNIGPLDHCKPTTP